MSFETYKDISGYEGLYQVSDLGDVKSLSRNGNRERLLKQEVIKRNHTNYRRVSLCKNGIVKRFAVHRLVLQTFLENPENKEHGNHIDNNGENNALVNLEWCTHKENMEHCSNQNRIHKRTKTYSIVQLLEGKIINRFNSIREASRITGFDRHFISKATNTTTTLHGYHFTKEEQAYE